jgi:hypothetical protein
MLKGGPGCGPLFYARLLHASRARLQCAKGRCSVMLPSLLKGREEPFDHDEVSMENESAGAAKATKTFTTPSNATAALEALHQAYAYFDVEAAVTCETPEYCEYLSAA